MCSENVLYMPLQTFLFIGYCCIVFIFFTVFFRLSNFSMDSLLTDRKKYPILYLRTRISPFGVDLFDDML